MPEMSDENERAQLVEHMADNYIVKVRFLPSNQRFATWLYCGQEIKINM